MNVLQITQFPVYPPKRGGDHRKHGLTLSFTAQGDLVTRFSQAACLDQYEEFELLDTVNIDDKYVEYRYKNPFHSLHRLNLLVGLPYLFHGVTLRIWKPRTLKKHIRRADIILVEEPWQVPAIRQYTETTPIVYSSHNVEAAKFEPDRYPRLGEWLQKVVDHTEQAAIDAADLIVCTSQRDKHDFKERYKISCPVYVAPNGVYESKVREHQPKNGKQIREKNHITDDEFVGLFVGSQYPPNNDAAEQLVRLMETHAEQLSEFHLLIVGSVSETVTNPPDNVTLAGFVDEIEPYYDAVDVALNPMRSGGGTNIKLLDYLARSLPVLSTPFGMRGFKTSDKEISVTAEISDFPNEILGLQSNTSLREKLQTNGREYVRDSYTWESISKALRNKLVEQFNLE